MYSLFDCVWIKLYYITYSPNVPDPADRTLRKRAKIGQRIGTKLRMAQYVMIRLYYSVVRCTMMYYVLCSNKVVLCSSRVVLCSNKGALFSNKILHVLINVYYVLIKDYVLIRCIYYVFF